MRLTPFYHHSGNPLFDVEARRAAWHDAQTLVRRTVVWVVGMCAAGFALFMVMWLVLFWNMPYSPTYFTMATFYLIFSLTFVSLWLDMACLRGSIRAINSEVLSGRWDLLRLTPIRIQTILSAKHAASQLRTWRTLAAVIGMRAALVLIMLLWVPFSLNEVTYGLRYTQSIPPAYVVVLVYAVPLGLVLMIEPLWRMRAVTALGVAVSALTRDHTGAWLLGVAAVFVVWLGHLVVLVGVAISWGMFSFMFVLGSSWLSFLCLVPVGVSIFTLAAYGYYLVVRTWAIRRTWKRLAKREW
jgi:hypothetical protein